MAQKEIFLQMDILAASELRVGEDATWVKRHLHIFINYYFDSHPF